MKRKDLGYITSLQQEEVSLDLLDKECSFLLANLDGWIKKKSKSGITIYSKSNVFDKITSVRYTAIIDQSLEVIENFAYDAMLENMPKWSKEFMGGELLEQINDHESILKTKFKTPFFLKNREYVFYLGKIRSANELKVIYRSIDHPNYKEVSSGFIRSKLYPTIYKFTKINDQQTQIEHILSTDLGKDLPLWFQNNAMVVNGVVNANYRDCINIKRALENKK